MPVNNIATPGPWIAKTASFGFSIWEENLYGKGYTEPVATIYNHTKSMEANANLIAAAPDLRDALQKLINASIGVGLSCGHPAIIEAKQAIQKTSL